MTPVLKALQTELHRVEALIFSIQHAICKFEPVPSPAECLVLEQRLFAAIGRREGVLAAIALVKVEETKREQKETN